MHLDSSALGQARQALANGGHVKGVGVVEVVIAGLGQRHLLRGQAAVKGVLGQHDHALVVELLHVQKGRKEWS